MALLAPVNVRDALSQAVRKESSEPSPTPEPSTPATEPTPPAREPEESTVGVGQYDPRLTEDLEAELSALPPEQRKVLEPLVAKFRKPYDKAFHKAMAEAAELKRQLTSKLSEDSKDSGDGVPIKAQRVLKGFYRDLEEATDPAVKESIRKSIERLEEHVEDMAESRVLKPLMDRLEKLELSIQSERRQTRSAEVDALENDHGYPSSLVEKYRTELLQWGVQFPNESMEDILFKVAKASEMKSVLSKAPRSPTTPSARSASPASPSSSAVSDQEFSSAKEKDGSWNIRKLMNQVMRKK